MGRAEVASLEQLDQKVRPMTLARDLVFAVSPPLDALLPAGLPRGAVVAVTAAPGVQGTTSLAFALAGAPSQAGAWVAAVGLGSMGVVAARGLGIVSERLVMVQAPERHKTLSSVVAALVDGFDVVLMGPEARRRLRTGDTRRLMARVRERGAILLVVGDDLPGGSAQLRLRVVASSWENLDRGAGYLRRRRATVEAGGRGAASRPRRAEVVLPDSDGAPAVPSVVQLHAVR